MMRVFLLCALLLCSGCASIPYGNFIDSNSQYDLIADDVLKKLIVIYPPAKTAFALLHDIKPQDVFGAMLIEQMRVQGYAIAEHANDSSAANSLAYTLDRVADMYRVTLYLNSDQLSRLYQTVSGTFVPYGPWSLLSSESYDDRAR